jgi:sortase B
MLGESEMSDLNERSSEQKIRKSKSNKRKNILNNILLAVCIIVFCYSAYKLIKSGLDTYKSKKENNKMADIFYGPTEIPTKTEDTIPTPTPEPETLEQKFSRLTSINSDIKAWINVANTNIDYAVVKASDNDYYLRRNIYKKYSYSGSIFMDWRCSIWDKTTSNVIIYGHNMKADNMFHQLQKFKKEDFFKDESNVITLYTSEGTITARVFSAYVTDTGFNYLQPSFADAQAYKEYLDAITSKSMFVSSVSVSTEDRIITLSTCDYDFNDARLVIHAKIIQ